MQPETDLILPELYGELTYSPVGKKWYAIYTKPRREKKLAEFAYKNRITYFLPLIDSVKVYERKRIVYKKPMFSSYIFINADFHQKRSVIVSGLTVSFINIEDEKIFLAELNHIYNVRLSKVESVPHKFITQGTRVRFISGPLKGVIGLVTDTKNMKEVVLQINILRQAIAVSAQSNNLEILDRFDDEDLD